MLLQLELTAAKATLENFNARTEKCGPDKVPAITMKISAPVGADVLAFFSPTLRDHLFVSNENDLAGPVVKLRYPHLEYPLALDHEMTGATVRIAYGVDKPLEFSDSVLKDFRVTPMDGGGLVLAFKVHNRATADQVAKLYMLQEQAIEISVEPIVAGSAGKRYPGCPVTEPGAKCDTCEASCEGPWVAYPLSEKAERARARQQDRIDARRWRYARQSLAI